MKHKAIIMLSFGTTYAETREKNIHTLTREVKERYPDYQVLEAFSSQRVRKILSERDKIQIPSLTEAMYELAEQKITELIVFPTHILGGYEYEKCRAEFEAWKAQFVRAVFGRPLLTLPQDYELVTKAIWEELSHLLPGRETPVIFMGHGTTHQADEVYEKLEAAFQKFCSPKIWLTTVEGRFDTERAIENLIQRKDRNQEQKQVVVTPFMLVAGDHAVNDMAGEEDAISTQLKTAGFEPVCIMKGIGEYHSVRSLYLSHLQGVL